SGILRILALLAREFAPPSVAEERPLHCARATRPFEIRSPPLLASPRKIPLPRLASNIPAEGRPPARISSNPRSYPVSSNGLPEIVILAGARTPMAEWIGGKRGDGLAGGALAPVSAIELGAVAAKAALSRAGVTPETIDHAVFGNALQTSGDALYGA